MDDRKKPHGKNSLLPALAGGLALGALSFGLPNPAHGQSIPAAGSEVQEVEVTAERHSEKLKDVPETVSRISATTLQQIDADGEDIRVLAARVPSLNIESSFGRTFPRLYIRGLGNSDYYDNASQPVSIVYDDVVLENPILKSFPIFDISDVEVLAGPQGTLFGQNTPAGVIKITSNAPVDKVEASTDLSWGTYNTINTTDMLNLPLVKGLLDARLAIQDQHRNNWVRNTYSSPNEATQPVTRNLEGYDDLAGKLALLYRVSGDLYTEITGTSRELDGSARLFRANIIEKGSNKLVSGFESGDVALNGINKQTLNTRGVHLNVRDDAGPITVNVVGSYDHANVFSQGDIDGGVTPAPDYYDVETASFIPAIDQYAGELRASTNDLGRFFDQAGIYYFQEYLDINNLSYNAPTNAISENTNERQGDNEKAIFDSATYRLLDPLKLGAGVRYTADQKKYADYDTLAATGGAASSNTSKITWDTNATFTVTPESNLYYRIATGYMPAAMHYNTNDYAKPEVARPSTTISYEVGIKGSILQHRLDYAVDAYAWNTHDMELTAVGGSGNIVTILNADKVIGRGVEAQADARPTDDLSLHASASYNFTEIEQKGLTVSGCTGGCTMKNAEDGNSGNYYINGNPLPQAPRFILNGSARYDVPWKDDKVFYVSSDWSWRSGVDFFLYRADEYDGQSLLQGGLRVGMQDYDHDLEVAAYVRNILNTVVATGAIDFENIEGFVNDPRIAGVEVSKQF